MKLTLQIKLLPTIEQNNILLKTLKDANRICNIISKFAWKNKIFHQFDIHQRIYKIIKNKTNFSSQMIIRCLSKVADTYTRNKKIQHIFKSTGSIAYDNRILSYNSKQHQISIWTVNGRITIPFICHNEKMLPYIKGEAFIILKNKKWFLFQIIEVPEKEINDIEEFIGIDFGIINLATTSTGKNFSGKEIDNNRIRINTLRKNLQKKGTKSAKKHLKKLSGKETRFKRNTNHIVSKEIIKLAQRHSKAIAIENLKGFRATVRKSEKERFGRWSFDQLRKFIEYKAKLNGIKIVVIKPQYTSITCSICGYVDKLNRKSQSLFSCKKCGTELNADFNAAINIAQRASINKPIVSPSGRYKSTI